MTFKEAITARAAARQAAEHAVTRADELRVQLVDLAQTGDDITDEMTVRAQRLAADIDQCDAIAGDAITRAQQCQHRIDELRAYGEAQRAEKAALASMVTGARTEILS